MDIDVALAIDAEAEDVTWRPRGADIFDARGNGVPGVRADVPGRAAIQPTNGRNIQDLPEGVREEAMYVGWTRSTVAVDDHIVYRGDTYRVIAAKPRPMDGFTRIALGRFVP